MAQVFRLPDIGEGLTEAEVVRWLVAVGEWVERDQPVVEVETAKAVVEIPSPFAGVVLHHGGEEGSVVAVGDILLVVGERDEQWTPGEEIPGGEETPGEETPGEETPGEETPGEETPGGEPAAIVGSIPTQAQEVPTASEPATALRAETVQALPVVRKLARELGVDLNAVTGSGPGGRITREDVESAATASEPGGGAVAPARPPVGPPGRRPLSRLRRTIAENLTRSWREIPHVTTFDEVDASRLLAARRALAQRHGRPLPLDALLVKAVIPALEEFPEFRATFDERELIVHGVSPIGVAVDTEEGLMVVVIGDADRLSVLDLAAEVQRLAEGARARILTPAEVTGQVFTVSNIGAVGGGLGTPIIPFGTTGILSCGRVEERPVVRQGNLEVAPMMPLALSFDHRVIDGSLGRRFMAMVLENLAEPALFLA